MKAELKAKFLQYLNQKQRDEGFTLIELLVVIIIIGILSAIALPSFLSQANKGKQSEAKTYVSSLNRAQQAYYLEKNKFAANVAEVGIGIQTQTANYTYITTPVPPLPNAPVGSTNYAISYAVAVSSSPLKNYAGKVYIPPQTGNPNDVILLSFLCESQQPGPVQGDPTGTSCPSNWNPVGN